MRTHRPLAVALALVVLLAGAAPAALADDGTFTVDVTQDTSTKTATVTVTHNGTAVENATVNVTSAASYAGTGEYETGPNGTVSLPAPETDVTVNVTATEGNLSAETSATLDAPDNLTVSVDQFDDGSATATVTRGNETVENASVTVTANATYDGTGNYTTGESGVVNLPAPNQTVKVTVNATHDGDETSTTTTLLPPEQVNATTPFGQRVSSFVHSLLDDHEAGAGIEVANFVLAHNPGNPPEHAGPPENKTSQGPPAHAGPPENKTSQGPPAHAGGNNTAQNGGNTTAQDGGGPPENAGNDEKGGQSGSSSSGNDGGGPPSHAKGN